jgi:hypothetical protein
MNTAQIDEKIIQIADVLDQIERLNQMVDFHLNQSGEESMRLQYEYMRRQFVTKLNDLIQSFQWMVQPLEEGA